MTAATLVLGLPTRMPELNVDDTLADRPRRMITFDDETAPTPEPEHQPAA